MKLTSNKGNLVEVKFYYDVFEGKTPKQQRRIVDCVVTFKGNNFVGQSTCHPTDLFVKAKGREISLLNATVTMDREDRKEVIETWLKRPGKKASGF